MIATAPCFETINKSNGQFTTCIILNLNFMSSTFLPKIYLKQGILVHSIALRDPVAIRLECV